MAFFIVFFFMTLGLNAQQNGADPVPVFESQGNIQRINEDGSVEAVIPVPREIIPLHEAVWKKDAEKLKKEIKKTDDIYVRNSDGETALHLCAYRYDSKIARILLDSGIDVEARDDSGRTPLSLAAELFNLHFVLFLLANGADINTYSYYGVTPLHYAVEDWILSDGIEHQTEFVKVLLLNGADVNCTTDRGTTPLMDAVSQTFNSSGRSSGSSETRVSSVVSIAADDSEIQRNGTAETQLVELLISFGADVNMKDSDGETALHKADTIEAAKILIENGAEVNIKNKNGLLPYQAVRYEEVKEYLKSLTE